MATNNQEKDLNMMWSMLRELNRLPVLTKIIVSVCLAVPTVAYWLLDSYLALEALRVSEVAQLLPELPDRGAGAMQFLKLGVEQSVFVFWLLRLLNIAIAVAVILLFCIWWPRKPKGVVVE
jgi:hypothetical protein